MRVAALALVALSIGCRRSTSTSTDAAPVVVAPSPATTEQAPVEGEPLAHEPRPLPPAEGPYDNVTFDTGVIEEPGKTITTAPKMDPFDQAMNDVRSSSVGCFSALPPGEYNASIAVTVTPSGIATRVEVTSGPDDEAVRKCLQSAATRSYPTSPDGRKLTISVQVKG